MIRFTLQCPEGHRFESWFRDGGAFEALSKSGELACPDCGSAEITKCLMTPQVRPARSAAAPPAETPAPAAPPTPALAATSDREQALAALKVRVEAEADYVGMGFVREARAIHTGDAPDRPIYGEAKPAEAIALIEDGVPVAPLPFVPTRKVN
ncbi:MAG TPA: DUF1178 domain-containing protein [Rhodobacteraceae bacterium]|nr:DUF1178 domain-containing protein [Paracoccaceae bacterium]